MAYQVYLDGVLLPVAPSKLQLKTGNQNQTMNLINGQEINRINLPGLTEIAFEAMLPHTDYPFAEYEDGFLEPDYYLNKLELLKRNCRPFQFICLRPTPGGGEAFDTNMTVSLEDYTIGEDVSEGRDVLVSVNLKQYAAYGTRTFDLQPGEQEGAALTENGPERETENAPRPRTYRVKRGDCLWSIAKSCLGNGARYKEIYELNRNQIRNPSLIYPDQVLTMPQEVEGVRADD